MDNRPIGVFDSGLGGLTSVRRFLQVLPGEDIIYLGDTGRVPYGSRSRETIIKYALQDAAFLYAHNIKAMVIACNTVCATALDVLRQKYDIPVFEVVEPAVSKAAQVTKNGRIGLIGTEATIHSGAYERLLAKHAPESRVFGKACPLFVPLVENGRIHVGDTVIETVAEEYLEELKKENIDTLILGCTHYPLLSSVISKTMGDGVYLVDSGAVTAESAAEKLKKNELLSGKKDGGCRKYFVTDSTQAFGRLASMFLGSEVLDEVEQVTLDNF